MSILSKVTSTTVLAGIARFAAGYQACKYRSSLNTTFSRKNKIPPSAELLAVAVKSGKIEIASNILYQS